MARPPERSARPRPDRDLDEVMRAVRALSDRLTPSQQAAVTTARAWSLVLDGAVTLAACIVALFVMVGGGVLIPVGLPVFFVLGIGGVLAARHVVRELKTLIFTRLLERLDATTTVRGAIGGATSAGSPVLPNRR